MDITALNGKFDILNNRLTAIIAQRPAQWMPRLPDAAAVTVASQSRVWIVMRKTDFDKYQALKTLATQLSGTGDAFKGLAWAADGLPMTDWCIEGSVQAAMGESTAKKLMASLG